MRMDCRALRYSLLIGSIALLSGCFGSFSLTRTVYKANRNVYSSVPGDNTQRKIAQSAVMWVFIPVYAVTGIADAAVFNVIEFWTGNRTEISRVEDGHGTAVALAPTRDGHEARIVVSRDGKVIGQERLIKVSKKKLELRDGQGNLKGTIVRSGHGKLEFKDADGQTLHTFTE